MTKIHKANEDDINRNQSYYIALIETELNKVGKISKSEQTKFRNTKNFHISKEN